MTGYKDLLTYKQSEEIYDLTVEFCQRFLPGREMLQQRDQMVQAARSGKQNIVEGYSFKSRQGYIRLLGVARGSLEELLEDYKDFARIHNIKLWDRNDARFRGLGSRGSRGSKSNLPLTPPDPSNPCYPINYLIKLTNQTCYLLHRQIEALEEKFIREGGYTENLFKRRLAYRRR